MQEKFVFSYVWNQYSWIMDVYNIYHQLYEWQHKNMCSLVKWTKILHNERFSLNSWVKYKKLLSSIDVPYHKRQYHKCKGIKVFCLLLTYFLAMTLLISFFYYFWKCLVFVDINNNNKSNNNNNNNNNNVHVHTYQHLKSSTVVTSFCLSPRLVGAWCCRLA